LSLAIPANLTIMLHRTDGSDFSGEILRPMLSFPKALAIIACLFSSGGQGKALSQRSPDCSREQSILAVFPRVDLIQSPVRVPPLPEPLVLSLNGTDIDEEDESDRAGDSAALSPFSSDAYATAPLSSRSPFAFEPSSEPRLVPIAPILRC
jgi:hypothetical protein